MKVFFMKIFQIVLILLILVKIATFDTTVANYSPNMVKPKDCVGLYLKYFSPHDMYTLSFTSTIL